jgi:hypothetical protein
MPYYPIPPVVGIVLNLVLTGVLVEYLLRTDRLALLLSVAWIVLGVLAYFALDRVGEDEPSASADPAAAGSSAAVETGSGRGSVADERASGADMADDVDD